MEKIYVLDTNVLLSDPEAIFAFADRDVVIPMAVIEELDKKKKEIGELGFHARKVFRILSEIRQQGSLWTGIKMEWAAAKAFAFNIPNVGGQSIIM